MMIRRYPTPALPTIVERFAAATLDMIALRALLIVALILGLAFDSVTLLLAALAAYGTLAFANEILLTAVRGQTFGKMLLHMRVVRVADGRIPGWWRSLVRFAASLAPLAYLPILYDSQRRGWHDRRAGTIVVKTS